MKATLLLSALLLATVAIAQPVPKSWTDPDTGHRIVRLTDEPGSASLYFNQNGYTADGKSLVYTTPNGISVLDLEKRESRQVVQGRVRLIDAGRKTPRVYYSRDGALYWTNTATNETKKIGDLPPRGSIATSTQTKPSSPAPTSKTRSKLPTPPTTTSPRATPSTSQKTKAK